MKYYFLTIIVGIVTLGAVAIFNPKVFEDKPKVDLPEEYREITRDTPIQGHFEGDVLVIEFKH